MTWHPTPIEALAPWGGVRARGRPRRRNSVVPSYRPPHDGRRRRGASVVSRLGGGAASIGNARSSSRGTSPSRTPCLARACSRPRVRSCAPESRVPSLCRAVSRAAPGASSPKARDVVNLVEDRQGQDLANPWDRAEPVKRVAIVALGFADVRVLSVVESHRSSSCANAHLPCGQPTLASGSRGRAV